MINATDLNCECTARVLSCRTYANGSEHWVYQCIACGLHTKSIKAEKAKKLIAAGEKWERYDEARAEKYRTMIRERNQRDRLDEKQRRLEEYNAYLSSESWKLKRNRVMKRANNLCEGCLCRPATQVHHLTYSHTGDELLYQLVALCGQCHEKAHGYE